MRPLHRHTNQNINTIPDSIIHDLCMRYLSSKVQFRTHSGVGFRSNSPKSGFRIRIDLMRIRIQYFSNCWSRSGSGSRSLLWNKFSGNLKFKYNFYTWIRIQQLKLMEIRIRNPGQNTDPDLIWSLVLRHPLNGRNLQLSCSLDHRSSPEPPVVWLAGILTERNGFRLKNPTWKPDQQ